ncbi:MAG: hypothetical protein E7E68_08885 [Staphylococcus sp.]|nr:hypothetical protein [Staphylococcus sp.]
MSSGHTGFHHISASAALGFVTESRPRCGPSPGAYIPGGVAVCV